MVPSLKRLPSLPASCPSAHFLYSGCHARWWRHMGKQAMVFAPRSVKTGQVLWRLGAWYYLPWNLVAVVLVSASR